MDSIALLMGYTSLVAVVTGLVYYFKLHTRSRYIFGVSGGITKRDLLDALANNEIVVYYQPQLSLSDGEIVGLEALSRWMSPTRGFVQPDNFIPLVEDYGLMHEFGDYVLNRVCLDMQDVLNRGISVGVNISVSQLSDKGLPSRLVNLVRGHGLHPSQFNLELTETVSMYTESGVTATLRKLQAEGFKIALDDYGTGYASLSSVKDFPVDVLKIDRSFVNGLTGFNGNDLFIRTILVLTKGLGILCIAEGVETKEQLKLLTSLGCDEVQGYLLSKPIPSAEMHEFFKKELVLV